MRLKAMFTIELDASDFVAAAELQKKLELTLAELQQKFPQATLKLTERRQRGPADRSVRAAGITGRMNVYRDD